MGPTKKSDDGIVALYCGGASMQEIGDLIGLSRERVRQRLLRNGVTGAGRSHRATHQDPDVLAVMRACRSPGIVSAAGASRLLGFSGPLPVLGTLRRLGCYEAVRRLWRWRRSSRIRKRLIAQMQTLAQRLGHTPRLADLVPMNGVDWFMSYVSAFGSLRAAQAAAGLTPNAVGGPGHLSRTARLPTSPA